MVYRSEHKINMKHTTLTARKYILGKLLGLFESVFIPRNATPHTITSNNGSVYHLVKSYDKTSDPQFTNKVGLYTDSTNKKVIIRTFAYTFKSLKYWQILHEAHILTLLHKLYSKNRTTISFPKLYESRDTGKILTVVREYVQGKSLGELSPQKQTTYLKQILQAFKSLTESMTNQDTNELPIRTSLQITLGYFYFTIKAIFFNPHILPIAVTTTQKFIHASLYCWCFGVKYILAHRDLNEDNIYISNGRAYIIDNELCLLAEEQTDLSIITRIYFTQLGLSNIYSMLSTILKSPAQKHSFVRLSLYYAIQSLASESISSNEYKTSLKYLHTLASHIYDFLFTTKSTANQLAKLMYLKTRLSLFSMLTVHNGNRFPIVLNYHSVGEDNWQFSISPSDFEEQISMLHKTKRFVTLDSVVNNDTYADSVAITFDDGYKNLLTSAIPLLKKYHIPATIFVIGNPNNTARTELDNSLELLTYKDIINLHNDGFEIGYHSATHPSFAKASIEELENEIMLGKAELENKLGFSVSYFAYPKGVYTDNIINIVKRAGFKAAFTVDAGVIRSNSNKFILGRICLDKLFIGHIFTLLLSQFGAVSYKNILKVSALRNKLALF